MQAPQLRAGKIRAPLEAHNEVMTNHNSKGVMACLVEKAAIMAEVLARSGWARRKSSGREHSFEASKRESRHSISGIAASCRKLGLVAHVARTSLR